MSRVNIDRQVDNTAKTEAQQQQQQPQQSSLRYADELEITKNIVRASALMRLKDGFDYELHEILVNMRAAQLIKDRAKMSLKHERQELKDLMHEYKTAQSKEERDQIYEKIKQKNVVIDQHLKLIRQADDEFAKQLKFASAHFDREEDMIHSYVRSLNLPQPLKFLLMIFYDTGHLMKITAFHLSTIKIKNSAVERAYLNDIVEAYKVRNLQKMTQLVEKAVADDDKVRTATQGQESLFENSVKDELVKALQAMKEAHTKLEQALQAHFQTLAEVEKLIQEKTKNSDNLQEPPTPSAPAV